MNEERMQLDDANGESSTDSRNDALSAPKDTKGPKVRNPRELDDARYAALDCRAHSDQGGALVAAVTNMVAAHELAAGARTNKRKKKQAALSSAVERLRTAMSVIVCSRRSWMPWWTLVCLRATRAIKGGANHSGLAWW